jgi:Ca2+-binding RTX toxin-like protein
MASNNQINRVNRIKGKGKKDILKGTKKQDWIEGMGGSDKIRSLAGNDKLIGGAGNDTLQGGKGKDILKGGKGNDTYLVDDLLDKVRETAGQGIDTVRAKVNYTLGNNLENLILLGSANLNGTGNSLDNNLTGNAGNNTLSGDSGNDTIDGGVGNDVIDGGMGADVMKGGLGDDLFYVNDAADVVLEDANGGIDKVITTVATYAKPANVEFIEYVGTGNFSVNFSTNGNSSPTGNQVVSGVGNDRIVGGAGNDNFSSGAGNDTLSGGGGDDTLDGGAGDDTLDGDMGNDTLDGGTGIDTLLGGLGNDLYLVDNIADKVQELLNAGLDTVKSTVDYVLADNLENLELLGPAITGIGNALDNLIKGTDGNNILDGGLGADELLGGLGDDTYIVDNLADRVVEAVGAGTDLIKSAVDYALGANQENVELLDGALTGLGNDLANSLIGNAADNILNGGLGDDSLLGGLGNDKLIGGAGVDQLTGGAGIDTFALLDTATNGLADTITDFDAANDILALGEAGFGALKSALGLVDGVAKTLNIGNDGVVGTLLNTVSPHLLYDAVTGQLKLDQNGSLLPGLGNGGVIATLKDVTGNAPALSNITVLLDSTLNALG